MPLPTGWIDVTAGGSLESTDLTDALEQALARVPDNERRWGPSNDRTDHGGVIYVPSAPPSASWRITRRIDVPATKNVRILGDTTCSTRLEYIGQGNHALFSRGQAGTRPRRRAHVFENLTFHRGGVLIEGESRFFTDFMNCCFTGIDGFGVETQGPGVVGVRILSCEFAETHAGVGVRHRACDNWIVGDNTRFVRLRGVGLESHSSGITIRDARFETKQPGGGNEPHIRITGDPPDEAIDGDKPFTGGECEITGCRFGGEVADETDGPPAVAVDLRPTAATAMLEMLVSRNRFNGRNGGPTETSARHAISVAGRLRNSVVTGNYFDQYYGPLVQEDDPAGRGSVPSNYFVANAVKVSPEEGGDPVPVDRLLSGAGSGWVVDNPVASAPPPSRLEG
jgi:hypothetical protein